MGEELLSEANSPVPKKQSFADIAEQQFPYYIAMGMTAHDYWHGDPCMLIAYRKADIIKRDRMNYEAWLNGAYVYSALCAVSPLLNALSKQHKANPYVEKPIAAKSKPKKLNKAEQERQEMEMQKAKWEAMMNAWNAQFEADQAKKNGGGDNG